VHVVKAFATEPVEIVKYNANCDQYFVRVLRRIRNVRQLSAGAPLDRDGVAPDRCFFCGAVLVIHNKLSPAIS